MKMIYLNANYVSTGRQDFNMKGVLTMINIDGHRMERGIIKPLRYIMPFMLFLFMLLVWDKPATVLATTTGTQVNVFVDYVEETARVTAGPGGSNKFYISLDKQKTWEDINPSTGLVDISALLSSKSVDIFFKGNKDTAVKTVTLMAEPDTVTATYVIKNGVGSIVYSVSGAAIEYRKGSNGKWKTPPAVFETYMYEVKGATLQFRSAANTATRAGKIVTVKIPKRPSPPSVKVDGSKLLITGIKPNETQYYNPATGWQFVSTDAKTKTVSLFTLSNTIPSSNASIPAGAYEFRNYSADKKVISGVKLVEVPAQPTCPDTIKLEGSTLTITDTQKRVYEYSRMSSTGTFNAATMKWTTIQPNKPTIIPKAYVTERIYVRLKSTVDKTTKLVTPASTYRDFLVTSLTIK
jgi:hypothetical protein